MFAIRRIVPLVGRAARGPALRAVATFRPHQPALSLVGARFRCFSDVVQNLPSLGAESITEGTVMEWTKQVGEGVAKGEIVCVIETDKVTVEVEAQEAGVIAKHNVAVGDSVEVGAPLVTITAGAAPAGGAAPAAAAPTETPASTPEKAPPRDDGKASIRDGLKAAAEARAAPATPTPAAAAPKAPSKAPAAPASSAPSMPKGTRDERREKMTRMRQRISQRLKDAQNTAAMLTTFQEVDMTAAMEFRKEHKDQFEKTHGAKLGFMSLFAKASAAALMELPAVNAVIDDATNEIIFRDYVDISVAVASPRGLVVPVIRNVEAMGFADFEKALSHMGQKARNDQITMDDMTGGTFTISNGGVFGSMMGTPIINPPQSAILGMHSIKQRAMVMPNGEIKARPVMFLALTYDHRIIDGREAVLFLCSVRDKVQDPRKLLLDL